VGGQHGQPGRAAGALPRLRTLRDLDWRAFMTAHDWLPSVTKTTYGLPAVGSLIAYGHGVWRVDNVAPDLTDAERDRWVREGMPDPWRRGPHLIDVTYVGGVKPTEFGRRSDPSIVETLQIKRGQSEPMLSKSGEMTARPPVDPDRVKALARSVLAQIGSTP
jgi:hypothetical protein